MSTKAVLRVALSALPIPPDAMARLRLAASHRLTESGELIIAVSDSRRQEQNRRQALDELRRLVVAALVRPKTRRPTRPSRASKARRIEGKKRRGETKRLRRAE